MRTRDKQAGGHNKMRACHESEKVKIQLLSMITWELICNISDSICSRPAKSAVSTSSCGGWWTDEGQVETRGERRGKKPPWSTLLSLSHSTTGTVGSARKHNLMTAALAQRGWRGWRKIRCMWRAPEWIHAHAHMVAYHTPSFIVNCHSPLACQPQCIAKPDHFLAVTTICKSICKPRYIALYKNEHISIGIAPCKPDHFSITSLSTSPTVSPLVSSYASLFVSPNVSLHRPLQTQPFFHQYHTLLQLFY